MHRSLSAREANTWLYEIDNQFNPFFETKIERRNVFFIYGNKIDKTFYYNHRHPNLNLPHILKTHFMGYFDIIALFSPDMDMGGTLGLKFLKGHDIYQHILTNRTAHAPTATVENPSSPQTSKNPKMNHLRSRMRANFEKSVENAQPLISEHQIYYEDNPNEMIKMFHSTIFSNRRYKTLLILSSFSDWATAISDNTNTLNYLKWWSENPQFRSSGNMVVFLTKDDFTTSRHQTTPDGYAQPLPPNLEVAYRAMAEGGNSVSIELNGHTTQEIESFLSVYAVEKPIPFPIEHINQVATTLATASTGVYQKKDLPNFDPRTFDINELYTQLQFPATWHSYYKGAEKIAGLVDYGHRLINQIYYPEVFENLFKWLRGAMNTIYEEDNLTKVKSLRNIYLYGPAGTGKTSFIGALVSEFKFGLVEANFQGMHIGESMAMINRNFDNARTMFQKMRPSPVILFQDEFGRIVYPDEQGNQHSYIKEAVEAYKHETDSLRDNDGVFLMAAGNESNIGDKALQRRFSKMLLIPLPGPTEIYRYIHKYFPVNELPNTDWRTISHQLYEDGFSLALLDLVNNDLQDDLEQNGRLVERNLHVAIQSQSNKASSEHFFEDTQRLYPDIGTWRDPKDAEAHILSLIETTKKFVFDKLTELRQRR